MRRVTSIILISILVFQVSLANAQNLIAVQNGGAPKFYSILENAINNAQNKDTIYISGGAFSFSTTITIDKELHFMGTGYHPDSTKVLPTQINSSIVLVSGANNSSFEGFLLNGDIVTVSINEDVDKISIQRCYFRSIRLSRSSEYWVVRENIITGNVSGGDNSMQPFAQNNIFSNNIIGEFISCFGPNNEFRNNFMNGGYFYLNKIDGCFFKNNIFNINSYDQNRYYTISSSVFENNIFSGSSFIPSGCINRNNIDQQSSASTFVNQSLTYFDYTQDYHLKTDSPGRNAGTDGSDIGIYGGTYPWKEGSIPANPHFQRIQIGTKTDINGNLNVKIKIAAQDH